MSSRKQLFLETRLTFPFLLPRWGSIRTLFRLARKDARADLHLFCDYYSAGERKGQKLSEDEEKVFRPTRTSTSSSPRRGLYLFLPFHRGNDAYPRLSFRGTEPIRYGAGKSKGKRASKGRRCFLSTIHHPDPPPCPSFSSKLPSYLPLNQTSTTWPLLPTSRTPRTSTCTSRMLSTTEATSLTPPRRRSSFER